MKLQRLVLRNFRNIEEVTFSPSSGLNVLIGANGQGKTSLIESIGYLGLLRSFRGAHSDEVMRWNSQGAEIRAWVSPTGELGDPWTTELRINFEASSSLSGRRITKTAWINGKSHRSSTSYLSQRFGEVELGFHAVVFNPADHDLVRGEPSIRRAYLDRVLGAQDLEYLKTLQKYQKSLEQRNALLKEEGPLSEPLWRSFSEPLVSLGAWLAWKRLGWIQAAQPKATEHQSEIAPSQPKLGICYVSNWVPKIANLSLSSRDLDSLHFAGQEGVPSLEKLEQSFWNQMVLLREAERRAGSTLVGPHRDDWTFLIGNQVLRGHGSQGEVRSALLALKLSEIQLFQEATGHQPILLLDDFSSELDRDRRTTLLNALTREDLQVFVTSTEDSVGTGLRFQVHEGKLQSDVTAKEALEGTIR